VRGLTSHSAGAQISARDDEYRSTQLAWAAVQRAGHGAGTAVSQRTDEPAGRRAVGNTTRVAVRRGHAQIASILRSAGATA